MTSHTNCPAPASATPQASAWPGSANTSVLTSTRVPISTMLRRIGAAAVAAKRCIEFSIPPKSATSAMNIR